MHRQSKVRRAAFVASSLCVSMIASASWAQATIRASVNTLGQSGNGASFWVALSGDARYVAFTSQANNLTASDQNSTNDVFVRDTQTQETRCVSLNANGVPANSSSWGSTISHDGRFVAFYSHASDLVPGTQSGVYVRDLATGDISVVSVNSAGQHSGATAGFYGRLSMSSTGRFVCFDNTAPGLVPDDTEGFRDIFVHDRDTDANGVYDQPGGIKTIRVSVSTDGQAADGDSDLPQITGNGRFVVFDSVASNLVSRDKNGKWDIFVHDRDVDADGVFDEPGGYQTSRVNFGPNGEESDGPDTWWGTISGDGRLVAYHSNSTNIVSENTIGRQHVFLHDRLTGLTQLISRTPTGELGNGFSALPQFSEDSRFVSFYSFGSDIIENDTNNGPDVFVYNRFSGLISLANITATGQQAGALGVGNQVFAPAISPDGRHVGIVTVANGVVSGDQNGLADTYLRDRGPMKDADIDASGIVDIDDLLQIIGQWGPCQQPCPPSCIADVFPPAGNCVVDIDDLLEVIGNWD